MASNTQRKDLKGYDHKFVDEVSDELLCLICLLIARDPQQSTCCGKVYCQACVTDLKKHSKKCPQCRGDINCFPDKRSDRNIKSLKISCDNADNGCKWTDELRSLGEHLLGCDYTFLSCPNECEDGDKILCKDMEKHKTEECPRRQYVCSHCSESGEYEERTTTHLEECPHMEIPCSNDGCCELVARYDVHAHCNVCEFEMVPCKYATLGCDMEVLRKDLKEHENDREQHLDLAINAVPEHADTLHKIKHWKLSNLERQISEQRETTELLQDDVFRIDNSVYYQDSELKALCTKQNEMDKQHKNTLARLQSIILAQNKEISQLKLKLERQEHARSNYLWYSHVHVTQSQPPTLDPVSNKDLNVFKFTDYAKRKSRNSSAFSPPIYSSPGGYKMCINVLPNGAGKGKGTHVSVYAYLMRGENDDHLSWPFTGTIVVELLNQLTDRNHHSVTTKMSEDNDVSQRILEGDRAKSGYGCHLYIAHSYLDYNAAKNCQYLMDDCLYFRFQINSAVAPKPWLSSADVF